MKIKKAAKPRDLLFRFLFGFQKGSRVWGKAPLLPHSNKATALKFVAFITNTEAGEAAASGVEKAVWGYLR